MILHEQDNKIRESILTYSPYNEHAEKSKARVWEKVRANQQDKTGFTWVKYASVIILAICLPLAGYIGYNLNKSEQLTKSAKKLHKQLEITLINRNTMLDSNNKSANKKREQTTYIASNVHVAKINKEEIKKEAELSPDSNNMETNEYNELIIKNTLVDNHMEDETSKNKPGKNKTKKRLNISDLLAARKNTKPPIVKYEINSKINIVKNKKSKIISFGYEYQQQETVSINKILARR